MPDAGARRTQHHAAAPDRRPVAMLWGATCLLAIFVVMGTLVALNPAHPFTQPLDDWWRSVIGESPDAPLHGSIVAMFFQHLGELPGAVVVVVVVPLLFVAVGRWRTVLYFLSLTFVGPGLFSQGMKNLVERPRPATDEALGLFGPLFRVDHGSFPSGHAVMAGVLAVGVLAVIPASRRALRNTWGVIGVLLMLGMIWQRTLVNAHWLTDTVFGLIAGAAAALLMWWAFWPLIRRDYGRPVWFMHPRQRSSRAHPDPAQHP